jgi:hypothetical protein
VDLNPSTGNPEVSGQMLVPNGGTGLSSVAANELLVGSITSTTTLSVVPIASANGHILYFNSGGLQWQAPPAINSVLFPNVQGSTTPNTNQSMLVGSGSSLTIATGSTGQIEATRFGRNRTHSNRTDRVDLNLPTPQGQQTPEEPEINGVLQVANGGLGLSQPGTAGQLLGVTGVGATAAPTWLDGTSTGGGTGAGPAQPHNLTSTSKTIQTASLVNVSFVIVSSNTNKLDMILGDGVDGQLLVVMYEQSGNTQHSVLFKTNGSQNVIMRKQLLLRDKDAAMFIFRAKTGTDPGDWIYIGENN